MKLFLEGVHKLAKDRFCCMSSHVRSYTHLVLSFLGLSVCYFTKVKLSFYTLNYIFHNVLTSVKVIATWTSKPDFLQNAETIKLEQWNGNKAMKLCTGKKQNLILRGNKKSKISNTFRKKKNFKGGICMW